MHRFYIAPSHISANRATLTGDDARHLQQVLRLKKGVRIGLFDGLGTTYTAAVEEIKKSTVDTVIIDSRVEQKNPPFIKLAQCVVKKKQMELIIQKGTELGASSFTPIIAHNCSLNYPPSTQESRWQKIALEACKQCGQSFIPPVEKTLNFSNLLDNCCAYETKIILWENETEKELQPIQTKNLLGDILLLVGPEGGFTAEEVATARSAGFACASLGALTLRAETAAISALSIVQYLIRTYRE